MAGHDDERPSALRPLERALGQLMSDLSEQCWCARWNDGTELDIWELVQGRRSGWGLYEQVDQAALDAIRHVAEAAGSWVEWDDEAPASDDWLRAVPLDEWRRRPGSQPDGPMPAEHVVIEAGELSAGALAGELLRLATEDACGCSGHGCSTCWAIAVMLEARRRLERAAAAINGR